MPFISFFTKERQRREDIRQEFYDCVGSLLFHRQLQRLDGFLQHYNYTRLRHCMEVSYLSFRICKKLGLNSAAAARGGLLHDLYFPTDLIGCRRPWREHPAIALENARQICTLSPLEEDIILKHMWLVNFSMPRYRESFVVTFVDKLCATREFLKGLRRAKPVYSVFES